MGNDFFRIGYNRPLLKCVTLEQAEYIIRETHNDIYGYHSGARTMATQILRAW